MNMSTGHHILLLMQWILLLAFFFAKVEIHIEGRCGWAKSLPTWRLEKHWLLNVFWAGKPLTGYHLWLFSFMFFVFHLHFFMSGDWSLKGEARTLASLMLFWIIEDFLWFVMNPAFGIGKFKKEHAPWHNNWFLHFPVDYWVFIPAAIALMIYSFR